MSRTRKYNINSKYIICNNCNELKSRDEFYESALKQYRYICKPCFNKKCKNYRLHSRDKKIDELYNLPFEKFKEKVKIEI